MQQLQNGSVHRGPCFALRVDDIKVVDSRYNCHRDIITLASCHLRPSDWQLWRNLSVVRALDQDLRHIQRQQGSGISGTVSHLKLRRGASHEAVDLALIVGKGEVAGEVTEELQIDCSRGGDQTVQRYPWLGS
jgi:hypothetical protein